MTNAGGQTCTSPIEHESSSGDVEFHEVHKISELQNLMEVEGCTAFPSGLAAEYPQLFTSLSLFFEHVKETALNEAAACCKDGRLRRSFHSCTFMVTPSVLADVQLLLQCSKHTMKNARLHCPYVLARKETLDVSAKRGFVFILH